MEYYPLTTPQKNIWNLQKYYADTAISNLCGAVFYQEKRSEALMKQSIRQFINSQSGIRLRFHEGEEPVQYVGPEDREDIPVLNFPSMEEFDRYAEEFACRPLGLTDRAMYRFVVFHVEERSGILVALSHLVADAWTFGLMANQIDVAYRRLEKESDEPLIQGDYRAFIEKETLYFSSERCRKDRTYWEQTYVDRPEESPVRLRSIPDTSVAAKRVTGVLPLFLERKLEAFCRDFSVTPAVLFETVLILYLARLNPENRTVTIGVPVLNRSNAREKEIAGMFISTMPLTVEVKGKMSVSELARQTGRKHMDIFRHQKFPYGEILRTLREKQNFSGNLYDVMVSYQNAKTLTETNTKWYSNGCSEIPLTIHIDNRDGKESHTVNVDYQTAVFCPEEISWLLERLEYILEQVVEDGDKTIGDVDILPERERKMVTEEFNDTAVDYPGDKCVHELFEEQAKRTPDRVALVFEDKKFTYRQLDEMSNGLAWFLREKGIGYGDRVAVLLKRDERVIMAQIAVLKLGAVFIPIDNRYPVDRIEYILAESNAKIILKNADIDMHFPNECSIEEWDYLPVKVALSYHKPSDEACYVIFTSGSTGQPKGCVLTDRGLVNFCRNNNILEKCNRLKKQICVSVNTISFDFFIAESLLPLSNGYTVALANERESTDQRMFSKLVLKSHVNIIQTTPTRYRLYFADQGDMAYAKQFDVIVTSGEALSPELLARFMKDTDAFVFNPLGPSECSIWVAGGELHLEEKKGRIPDITIGRPIANTRIYILDENSAPVPIGVAGELCIAGDGVGLGYLNRPELTARRFVPNPFATQENGHGKVMYHSGDLARWRTDGEIEYLGRMDTQVKIRGLRIELGEIESVMAGFPGIQLTAVADKRDGNGRQYLVGYYTSEERLDEKELRRHLASGLPRYMIPNYFLRLEAMPMTPSGKTDRKNLPVPDLTVREKEYLPPETEAEKKLAGIWEELLDIPQAGRTDDFFELGGDSLLAISLLNEIMDTFSVELSVGDVMEKATLEQMALYIERNEAHSAHEKEGILPLHEDRYVLLPQQKAIYAACQKDPDSLLYNMPARITLPAGIDRERLRQAIRQVTDRTKILKSRIISEGNELCGICDETMKIGFENGPARSFIRPFDLKSGPLFRVRFTEEALLFDIHHMIADGETVNLLLREIAEAYRGERLPVAELWYGDYAGYFSGYDFTEHMNYYRSMLKCDFEKVELPAAEKVGTGGCSVLYRIPEDIFSGVRGYAGRAHLTDTMVFLGAYGILLSRYTGRKDILSSIILRNRTHRQTGDMAGMFVNTLPIHLSVEKDTKIYFHRIKEMVLDLYRYQELPFREIADAVGMDDKTVVNTAFVYQADGEKKLILDGVELIPQPLDTHTSKFDFSMEITPLEHGGRMRLEYDCAKYDRALMDELADAYIRILGQLDKERTTDIEVLSGEMYHRITEEFNDTAVDYPKDKCIHELFEEQVERTPERVALVFEGREFTYRQLDEMSNSLACFLREKGIGNGDRVAVFLKRDEKVIMAQLAVLRLGAVFIPIDNRYPQERIEYILKESNARMVLKNMDSDMDFPEECIIEECDFSDMHGHDPCHISSDEACYIIFTSGSTGRPKGCMLTNRGLVNFCRNNNILEKCNQLKEQICVSVNTISFDFFIAESLLPLINGYTVVLANEQESMDRELFARLVVENHVNIIQTTPTRYRLYFPEQKETIYGKQLQVIVSSGEMLTGELFEFFARNTKASIFNTCGPSECSVWGMGGEQFSDAVSITIGRPIANTQIYILDGNSVPVPIGVPGELCIAGDGVGLGYLNQPELTAQRFIPNPFATQENGHGKIMYRTGDLARWRADGEIEYLGRMDTQVKIRGLRIELGEIESAMAAFPGVQLSAVTDKKDENGRQFLVGYYTSEEEPDEKELRKYLLSRLPRYMVPNYFLRLSAMPTTPGGKLDRKNLPMPEMTGREEDYPAPETETEKKLCALAEEVLGLERVGVEDDFFELGGDSLTAIAYVAKAHELGIVFPLQHVFDYPSVRSLCASLGMENISETRYVPVDTEKYQELLSGNKTEEALMPEEREMGNVFLTGATGFLGAHVLDCLMREGVGKIYCLVRKDGKTEPQERLRRILDYYFDGRYADEPGRRIHVVEGDVEEEKLWERLPRDVGTVIHTAASVKHYGSWEYFRRINREGTGHMVKVARALGARLVHVSTLSVSGNSMADDFSVYRSVEEKYFDETSLYIGQPLDNVYTRSKFEAECEVYDGIRDGLDGKVVRVGNLTNRLSDFRFQPNYKENAFLTRLRALLELGLFPDYLMPLYSEFSPVDKTAEGIVKIAGHAGRACVFHLYSNRPIYHDRFLEVLRQLEIPMKVVDGDTFHEALRQTMGRKETEYIYQALRNDMDERGRLVYDSNIHIVSDASLRFLEKVGFEWNETDLEYIRGYLEYFRKLGYLRV